WLLPRQTWMNSRRSSLALPMAELFQTEEGVSADGCREARTNPVTTVVPI
ncbi:MAG: hypothetical protein ACI92S_002303, partial [Planctomycetaceae bacterium]